MPEMRWRKAFSQDCSLMSFMPSSASEAVLMRRSFTLMSCDWMAASFLLMKRVMGIMSSITATPASVAGPSYGRGGGKRVLVARGGRARR